MSDRPDTGAREPQDELLVPFETTVREALEKGERDDRLLSGRDFDEAVWRLAENALAALAAGVGVPPDADLGCAPARERQDARWAEAARARMLELRRHPGHDGPTVCACTECALWTLLTVALDTLAGVGEARPAARGTTREDMLKDTMRPRDSVGAPAKEQPDARAKAEALLDGFGGRLERPSNLFETYARDCARHVVALTEELSGLREQLDALAELAKRAHNAAAAPDYDEEAIRDALWALARAALGVVAAPPNQTTDVVANSAKNAEVREGGSEA